MNSCSVSSFPVPSYNLNDEDIIGSDMTLLTTSKLKVKAFHVSFIFGRFYGLMLHLKVCTFSFSELLTWVNGRFDCIVKTWKVNEVDWGPSASVSNVLHQATSHFWCKELKSPSPTRFGCWIRTEGQTRLVTAATISSEHRFGRSSTSWKAYQVYFPTDPESSPYLFGVNHNHHFTI